MVEPGLDRHEWESEWASFEEDLAADPYGGLRYLHELMSRMLRERGVLDQSFVAREGADPDLLRPWETAAELVRKLDADQDVPEEDVAEAIESYRELFETLLAEREPP